MKKILLLIIGLSFFSFSSTAQSSWEKIYAQGDVIIEMKTEDCNPNDRLVPNTYGLLRYTNKSNQDIIFNFEMILEYNGVVQDNTPIDSGDPSKITTLNINANSSVTGNCNSREHYLKVFYKHNHPEMETQLTDIQFDQK